MQHRDYGWVKGLGIPAEKPAQVLHQRGHAKRARQQVQRGVAGAQVRLDGYLAWLGRRRDSHQEPGQSVQLAVCHAAEELLVGRADS